MQGSMAAALHFVPKELISDLNFPSAEVLSTEERIRQRKMALLKATRLGNVLRNKVKIVFEDALGIKAVETTVWATTERNIALKGGTIIPIHRILEVKFL